jgi:2,4-diketo-3-deoxy-L-fuconate hydrolase
MKLLRYGIRGTEQPGLLDDRGVIPDLSAHIDDIAGETVTHLTRLAAAAWRHLGESVLG